MTSSHAVSRHAGHIELAFDIVGEVASLLGAAPIPIVNGVLRLLCVILDMREVRLSLFMRFVHALSVRIC